MDEAQKAMQFVSISSDGLVNIWTMNKSELTHECLMKLTMVSVDNRPADSEGEDGTAAAMAGGCCMDFNKVGFRVSGCRV